MDIDPRRWVDFLSTHPVVLVVLLGIACGMAFTQAVKMTWLTWGNVQKIGRARYANGCMWLAIASTAALTHFWWAALIGTTGESHGLRELASTCNGIVSPCLYWGLKKGLLIWKPEWAKQLGDNGHTWPEEKP